MGRMDINERMDRVFDQRSVSSGLSDSDRNIEAGLAHEACESHCVNCEDCIMDTSLSVVDVDGEWVCEECKTPLDSAIALLLHLHGDMLDRREEAEAKDLGEVLELLAQAVGRDKGYKAEDGQ